MSHSQLPVLFLLTVQSFSIFGCKEYNQSDFGVDYLVMSMYRVLMYSFPSLEPVHCSMAGSNFCFLTCIQIAQETGKAVWYFHLVKNFLVCCCDPHKDFSVVSEAVVDVFLKSSCFFYDAMNVGDLISWSSAFSKSSLNIWKFSVHVLLKPGLENFEHYFASL